MKFKFLLASLALAASALPGFAETTYTPITAISEITEDGKYLIEAYKTTWGNSVVMYLDGTTVKAKAVSEVSSSALQDARLYPSNSAWSFTLLQTDTYQCGASAHADYQLMAASIDGKYISFPTSTTTSVSSTSNTFHFIPIEYTVSNCFNLHYNATNSDRKMLSFDAGGTFGYGSGDNTLTIISQNDYSWVIRIWQVNEDAASEQKIAHANALTDLATAKTSALSQLSDELTTVNSGVAAILGSTESITSDCYSEQVNLIDSYTLAEDATDITEAQTYLDAQVAAGKKAIYGAVASLLNGQFVTIRNQQYSTYLGVNASSSAVSTNESTCNSQDIWQVVTGDVNTYGANAITLYNPRSNLWLGTRTSFAQNYAAPAAQSGANYLLESYGANTWGFCTTGYTNSDNYTYLHRNTSYTAAIYWSPTGNASRWSIALATDDQIEQLKTDIATAYNTPLETYATGVPGAVLDATYTTQITNTANAATTDYAAIHTEIASIYDEGVNSLWNQIDGRTVIFKHNRSKYFLTANLTSAADATTKAGTLLGSSAMSENSLWTLAKVDGQNNQFKLYNQATGLYFSSGTSSSSPATLDGAGTIFELEAYASGSYTGMVNIKATTHTSGNSYLHFTGGTTNTMFYTRDDAGTPFSMYYVGQEIKDELNALETEGFSASDTGTGIGEYSTAKYSALINSMTDSISTDPTAVAALWAKFVDLTTNVNKPVFRIDNPNGFNSLTAGSAISYALTDPLNKNQYWTISATTENLEEGTYRIENYATGGTLFGNSTITLDENGMPGGLTLGGNSDWTLVYVGTTGSLALDNVATALTDYTAGNFPNARYISRNLGSGLGEYTSTESNIRQIAENFQTYTSSIENYIEHSDEAAELAAKLAACTLNLPTAGYLRIKSGRTRSADLSGEYYISNTNSTVSEKTSNCAMVKGCKDSNELSTIFYYNGTYLCSYETGRYIRSTNASGSGYAGNYTGEASGNTTSEATIVKFSAAQYDEKGAYQFQIHNGNRSVYANTDANKNNFYVDGGTATFIDKACAFNLEAVTELPVTTHSDGMVTLQVPVALQIPEVDGFTFYVAKYTDGTLRLHQASAGEKFCANTPVIIEGTADTTVRFAIVDENDTEINTFYTGTSANVALTAYTAQEGDDLPYIKTTPSTISGAAVKRRVESNTGSAITLTQLSDAAEIPANSMIVKIAADAQAAQESTISVTLPAGTDEEEDDMLFNTSSNSQVTTSISEVTDADKPDADLYNLQGLKMSTGALAPGIYIRGGKKVRL